VTLKSASVQRKRLPLLLKTNELLSAFVTPGVIGSLEAGNHSS